MLHVLKKVAVAAAAVLLAALAAPPLAAAKSFRYLGEDALTAAASRQIGDGAERAVEFLLEGGKERLVYRCVLDGQGRALSFASEER